jgi:hypothetical protein
MMPIDLALVINGNFTVFILHHQYQVSSDIILEFTAKESLIMKFGPLFVDITDVNVSNVSEILAKTVNS